MEKRMQTETSRDTSPGAYFLRYVHSCLWCLFKVNSKLFSICAAFCVRIIVVLYRQKSRQYITRGQKGEIQREPVLWSYHPSPVEKSSRQAIGRRRARSWTFCVSRVRCGHASQMCHRPMVLMLQASPSISGH